MKRIVQGVLMVALIATLAACQPVDREEADVEPGLAEVREQYIAAYNQHDAAAVAALYTDDAVFVNPQGTELSGRDQIQRELDTFFRDAGPQLTASATATEGAGELGWEIGSYQLELQLPAQPRPGEPAPLGAEPIGEPAATTQPAQPGQPGTPAQPGQPGLAAPQPHREEGHYLIVLEQGDDDRWLIRAHLAHAGATAGATPPQQPVTTPTTPGQERPLQPPPATGPAAEEPVRPQPREPAPPATTPEPDEGTEVHEDHLEPPPDDGDAAPGR